MEIMGSGGYINIPFEIQGSTLFSFFSALFLISLTFLNLLTFCYFRNFLMKQALPFSLFTSSFSQFPDVNSFKSKTILNLLEVIKTHYLRAIQFT